MKPIQSASSGYVPLYLIGDENYSEKNSKLLESVPRKHELLFKFEACEEGYPLAELARPFAEAHRSLSVLDV